VRRQRAIVTVLILFVCALALVRATGLFASEAAAPIQAQLGPGDQTGVASISSGAPPAARNGRGGGDIIDQVYLVSGLQVLAPAHSRVIATLGDSITDGAASDTDANGSWPDVLSRRFATSSDGAPVTVINMGIGSRDSTA
jgi:hypothetical protein